MGKLFQHRTRRERAHVLQGLTNRGQARDDVCGSLDVVESQDGHVRRNLQSCIMQCSYAADGGDVVETKNRREISAAQQQLVDSRIAKFGCVQVFVQLDGQVFGNVKRKRSGHLQDRLPSAL